MHRKASFKIFVTRREMLSVGDVPDHSLMLTEMEGEPVDYTPGVAGAFVYRRSVGFHDRAKGDGPMTGYATDRLRERRRLFQIYRGQDGRHDQGQMGGLQRHRQAERPQRRRHLHGEAHDTPGDFILEMEGDYTL